MTAPRAPDCHGLAFPTPTRRPSLTAQVLELSSRELALRLVGLKALLPGCDVVILMVRQPRWVPMPQPAIHTRAHSPPALPQRLHATMLC